MARITRDELTSTMDQQGMAWTDPPIQIHAYKSDSDINMMLEMISDSMARYVVFSAIRLSAVYRCSQIA
jgi:hypothetical protein